MREDSRRGEGKGGRHKYCERTESPPPLHSGWQKDLYVVCMFVAGYKAQHGIYKVVILVVMCTMPIGSLGAFTDAQI